MENRRPEDPDKPRTEGEKQDCELKAFARLAPEIKRLFPQTRLCLSMDSLYACGPVMTISERYGWHYVIVFKQGRLPNLWTDFQAHLDLCPANARTELADGGVRREFRWANGLVHVDTEGREHIVNAVTCVETLRGNRKLFAWITNFPVTASNVATLAQKGGRDRWKIEESFNMQKRGGYELEHVYGSSGPLMKCYYLLLQIAHLIMELVEKGSLLRNAVRSYGPSVVAAFGSLRNIARRFLDCLRYRLIPEESLHPTDKIQIRFDGL